MFLSSYAMLYALCSMHHAVFTRLRDDDCVAGFQHYVLAQVSVLDELFVIDGNPFILAAFFADNQYFLLVGPIREPTGHR